MQGCQYPESEVQDSCEILTQSISQSLPDTHIREDKESNLANLFATSRQGRLSQESPNSTDSMVRSYSHHSGAAATKRLLPAPTSALTARCSRKSFPSHHTIPGSQGPTPHRSLICLLARWHCHSLRRNISQHPEFHATDTT